MHPLIQWHLGHREAPEEAVRLFQEPRLFGYWRNACRVLDKEKVAEAFVLPLRERPDFAEVRRAARKGLPERRPRWARLPWQGRKSSWRDYVREAAFHLLVAAGEDALPRPWQWRLMLKVLELGKPPEKEIAREVARIAREAPAGLLTGLPMVKCHVRMAALLMDGPRPAREVKEQLQEEGYSARQVERARVRLGLRVDAAGFWGLPPMTPEQR